VHVAGKGYCRIRGDQHSAGEHKACAQKAIRLAKEKTASGDFDLIILDEVNNALELRLVDLPQVLDLLESKPPLMHLILTGKDAPPELIERAHTVSEVREIKHAFRQKIEPQKGVDY
jgi:cob(I)alamin adenosyltransferase